MCVLVVASRIIEHTPLVVAGNRDERFDRPAEPMTLLATEPRTMGGRDLVAGGTWFAANEHGVVAALTNKPQPLDAARRPRSRGELPLLLTRYADAAEAVGALGVDPQEFGPAWVFVGDPGSLFFIDLTQDAVVVAELPPGLHVLENRPYGAPSQKVDLVQRRLGGTMDDITAVLADHSVPDDEQPGERAELRAVCVHTDGYGTRWSGIASIDDAGSIRLRFTDGPPCTNPFVDAPGW